MKIDFRLRRLACAAVLIAVTGAASAESPMPEAGFYLQATGGVASYPKDPKVVLGDLTLRVTKVSEDDRSWGFTGGYRFNRHFAVEAGYVDLGEASADLVDPSGGDLKTYLRFAARGETLAAVALFPHGKWESFVKLGALFQNVDLHLDGTQGGVPFALSSGTSHGIRAFAEGGVSYRFDNNWKASLGVNLFRHVGESRETTGQAGIRSTFISVSYQF